MAYTKLFNSIITSTIWSEDDQTRIVWITMLAIADKNGEVQGSIPGLARIAGVPVEACRAAITKFLSPDIDSRTKDDEGRRIDVIEGGWHLLNHGKYRNMASDADRAEKAAIRQAKHREKVKRNAPTCHTIVTDSNASVTPESHQIPQADTNADTDSDTEAERKTRLNKPTTANFNEFWSAYPKKMAKSNAERAWDKIRPDLQSVLTALSWQTKLEDWTKENGKFIPFPATYLNSRRYEDEKPAFKSNADNFIKPKQLSQYDRL
jgi:hypothetical protein